MVRLGPDESEGSTNLDLEMNIDLRPSSPLWQAPYHRIELSYELSDDSVAWLHSTCGGTRSQEASGGESEATKKRRTIRRRDPAVASFQRCLRVVKPQHFGEDRRCAAVDVVFEIEGLRPSRRRVEERVLRDHSVQSARRERTP